ncbi:MAG: PKD domain-containing protein [Saprospiraceae bacterium]|nr:PKD domain-containing protein [Saprospiraceae bacterium]
MRNTQGISRSVTKSGFITVGTKPKANFTYSALGNNLVQFLNTSENEGLNATYLWSFGDGKTSIEASPLHQYANSGSFTARLTVQNNCGNETKEIVVSNLTTRVSSFDISNSIEIFPNPNTGEFIIKISNQENTKFNLNFYDQSGKLVFSKTLQKQSSKLEESLNLENLPSGQYIVEVIGEFQKGSKKIVIFR